MNLLLAVVAALSVVSGAACAQQQRQSARAPNLLLVLADQWRGQALGFLGEERVLTPAIDRLRAGGVELDQFTANDHLEDYRREYGGELSTWIGRHQPTDEGAQDPENMVDWRVCYDIELA